MGGEQDSSMVGDEREGEGQDEKKNKMGLLLATHGPVSSCRVWGRQTGRPLCVWAERVTVPMAEVLAEPGG